jgi:hypothetical protein
MISLVINLDTRPGFMENETVQGTMMNGTRSLDFFTDGVLNKVRFFEGHELETTVFIDVHERLPGEIELWLLDQHNAGVIDNLVFNRHTEQFLGESFQKWNDLNFLNAMTISRGDYLVHFDGDMSAFINDKSVIDEWLGWLDEGKYEYICYPSAYSPAPAVDPRFKAYWWASTRFFITKRDMGWTPHISDYWDVVRCLRNSEYLYSDKTFGASEEPRCPWLEHVIGIMATGKNTVFYPPIQPQRYLMFAWSRYYSGVLKQLNSWPYKKVVEYADRISYPCDVEAKPI